MVVLLDKLQIAVEVTRFSKISRPNKKLQPLYKFLKQHTIKSNGDSNIKIVSHLVFHETLVRFPEHAAIRTYGRFFSLHRRRQSFYVSSTTTGSSKKRVGDARLKWSLCKLS